jgi:EF hand
MMSTSTASIDNVSALASALFKRVDANNDGRLSTTEFQSFLENLLGKASSQQTPGLGSEAAAAAAAPGLARAAEARSYQPMLGFDYTKLNTPTHTTPKYVFARATQDVSLPWDRASRSAGLQQIVDYVKQNGYANATVTGDDTIDFGDGNGSIDVLTSEGTWWWGPKN